MKRTLLVIILTTCIHLVYCQETKHDLAVAPATDSSKISSDTAILSKVEVEAWFTGGSKSWAKFLQNNLNPNVPVANGAPRGSYQVIVRFIVFKDGSLGDIKALTHYGFGMEKEVIRILKLSPKWTPATQNGRIVNAYRKQPVTFVVDDD